MTDTLTAVYEVAGPDARRRADDLAVEQSHELPTDLAPAAALHSLARVTDFRDATGGGGIATVEYPVDLVGAELAQLLVVLLGNVSLQDGIRLVGVDLPESLAQGLGGGARLGAAGIRRVLGVESRPLLATALKPVGLGVEAIAALATDLALGGLDVIKDDQGLGNQPWAPFRERVQRVAAAVREANERSGRSAVYLPVVGGPIEEFDERLALVTESGAGGILVMPGITGFDSVRRAAAVLPAESIILSHPSFLGGFTASTSHGIDPATMFGTLLRIAGSDAAIFPSFGGRFSLTREQCAQIADASRAPLAGIPASLPTPGGGMTVAGVPDLVELYGRDVLLLIGSDLHRGGDLRVSAERFRAAAERA